MTETPMSHRVIGGLCAILFASPALAVSFDGVYRVSPTSDCSVTGAAGGALKIADNVFFGVQNQCDMTQPVNVRDMDAVLYDMVCTGDDGDWSQRALFMRAADGGLIMAWNGFAYKYDRCGDDPAQGTIITSDEIGITD